MSGFSIQSSCNRARSSFLGGVRGGEGILFFFACDILGWRRLGKNFGRTATATPVDIFDSDHGDSEVGYEEDQDESKVPPQMRWHIAELFEDVLCSLDS